jgi:leader peptidase (prepilin peptidase) / N-methyltransferase
MLYFLIGLFIGSFLNVCIYRLPKGESILFPPSRCPDCNHRLGVIDLIPVISYLFLRGRCRYCQSSISIRYPMVELLTGIIFFFISKTFINYQLFFYLIFASILIVISFIDLKDRVIPDSLSVGGIIMGLIFNAINHNFVSALLGATIGFAALFLIAKIGKLVFKKEAMGEGDFYLAALLGAFLGWKLLLVAVFAAFLFGGGVSILLLISGRVKIGQELPFGPALCVGGLGALFFGQQLLSWYLALFI